MNRNYNMKFSESNIMQQYNLYNSNSDEKKKMRSKTCVSHYYNSTNKKCDTSILKIKESYPNVKFLTNTEAENFPHKLMKILSRSDWEDIISWTPNGNSFMIHDKERLMQALSPCYYFEVTQYDNFRRKLNRWGFKILKHGVNAGALHHEYFIRDNPEICSKITRTKRTKPMKKKDNNSDGERLNKKAMELVNMSSNSAIQHNASTAYSKDKKIQNSNNKLIRDLYFKHRYSQSLLRESFFQSQVCLVEKKSEMKKKTKQQFEQLKTPNFHWMTDIAAATIVQESSYNVTNSVIKNVAKSITLDNVPHRSYFQNYDFSPTRSKYSSNNITSQNNKNNDNLNNTAPNTTAPFSTKELVTIHNSPFSSDDLNSIYYPILKISERMAPKKKIKFRRDEEEMDAATCYCDENVMGEKEDFELLTEVERQLDAANAMLNLRKVAAV